MKDKKSERVPYYSFSLFFFFSACTTHPPFTAEASALFIHSELWDFCR